MAEITFQNETLLNQIHLIRGQKVMLDADLAAIYGVGTKVLNQAVRRNLHRFPPDFMFVLNEEETTFLRSQIVTLEKGRGKYSKYSPFAFTEHGAVMLAAVLNSPTAVSASIFVVRAFVELRQAMDKYRELEEKIEALENALAIDPENAAAKSGLAFLTLTFGSANDVTDPRTPETVEVTESFDHAEHELANDEENIELK